jgi:beta-lactamase class A
LDLEASFAHVGAALAGRLGVVVKYLPDGPEYGYHADQTFATASVIKVAVLVEVFARAHEGSLNLGDRIELRDDDRVDGSGVLQFLGAGLALSVRDLAELMVIVSDNTATNMLIDLVSVDAVNARMRHLGLEHTTLGGKIGVRPESGERSSRWSVTTPREMMRLFEMLWRGEVVSAEASAAMLKILSHQCFMDLIRYLPCDDLTDLAGQAQSAIAVASKSGGINGVRNDVGLITVKTADGPRRYIVSAFTQDVEDGQLWTPENVALKAIGEVSRLAFEHLDSIFAGNGSEQPHIVSPVEIS